MIMKYINIPVFLVSLAIGLFFVYTSVPQPNIITIHPTPDKLNKLQFKDKADNCYEFTKTEVECPYYEDNSYIYKIPVQSV